MSNQIVDQVVDFYYALFERIFSDSSRPRIVERLKRDAVIRQVQDSAGAASQSLTRFFLNEQLTQEQVAGILDGFATLCDQLKLSDIANPNVTPETIVDNLLAYLPCPETVRQAGQDAIYRVALHSVVQVLMLVGSVMAEWQKLNFSNTFELPRRVVNRLNQIGEQLDVLGRAGQTAADEAYELSYRDYLLQRFHRIEAGTVRMTTSLDVDLRELFVMPRVRVRLSDKKRDGTDLADIATPMDLAAARALFGDHGRYSKQIKPEKKSEFTLAEKLRICREAALTMQTDDRAEYEADKVQHIFAVVLHDDTRAKMLFEHIRYRTGLLLERRAGIFAFAHLTFQEYLAALAIHEGNRLSINAERLVREHDDGRWNEVIALYCGLAPVPAARAMIERLIAQPDSFALSGVLVEAYLSAALELSQDHQLRHRVQERIAIAQQHACAA